MSADGTLGAPEAPGSLSTRAALAVVAAALAAHGALWLLVGAVARAAALYPGALPPNPYFVPEHFLLLYVGLPVTLTLAAAVPMAPAALLTLSFGHGDRVADWVIKTFVLAFFVNMPGLTLVRASLGFPPDPSVGRFAFLVLTLLAGGVLVWRARAGRVARPAWTPPEWRRLAWLAATPLVLSVALLPVLLWQDFNPDGLEALSMGRSLTEHVFPRLPTGYAAGLSVGMNTSSYPIHWLVTWLGPTEVAARAPLLMYAPALLLTLIALAELGRPRPMLFQEEACLALALIGSLVALAFNNSYHPYFADVASPANLDILAVTLIGAQLYFWWAGRTGALIAVSALAVWLRPTPLLFLGLLWGGALVVRGEARWRALRPLTLAIVVSVVTAVTFERGIVPLLGLPLEADGAQIGWRVRYFTFDDWGRLAYFFVPSGILPALALFAWPALDRNSRVLSLAVLGYFVFFYVRAFVALHHFAPAMIFPAVVLWRAALGKAPRVGLRWAAAGGAVAAIVLSLPRSFEVNRTMREIGYATEYSVGDYHGSWEAVRLAFDGKDVLDSIFRPYWDVPDPASELIGSAWVQVHYARDPNRPAVGTRYAVAPSRSALPAGFIPVLDGHLSVSAVRDSASWFEDRYAARDTDFESLLYAIPRETLLPSLGIPAGNYSLDPRTLFSR